MAVLRQKESWQPTAENFMEYRDYPVTDYGAFVYGIERLYDLYEQPTHIPVGQNQLVKNTSGIRRFTTEAMDWDKIVLPEVVKAFLLEDEAVRASNRVDVYVNRFSAPRLDPVVHGARTIWEYGRKVQEGEIGGYTVIGEDRYHTLFITPHDVLSRMFDLTIRKGFDYGEFLSNMTPDHDGYVANFALSGKFYTLHSDGTVSGRGHQDPRNFQIDIEEVPSPEKLIPALLVVQFSFAERERQPSAGILR